MILVWIIVARGVLRTRARATPRQIKRRSRTPPHVSSREMSPRTNRHSHGRAAETRRTTHLPYAHVPSYPRQCRPWVGLDRKPLHAATSAAPRLPIVSRESGDSTLRSRRRDDRREREDPILRRIPRNHNGASSPPAVAPPTIPLAVSLLTHPLSQSLLT